MQTIVNHSPCPWLDGAVWARALTTLLGPSEHPSLFFRFVYFIFNFTSYVYVYVEYMTVRTTAAAAAQYKQDAPLPQLT